MDWTFGIITGGNQEENIKKTIQSIEEQKIPNYEIIIIGYCNISGNNCKFMEFNENIKPMWITKKKNIITESAKYENIVYMHDYIKLENNWYNGFLEFGEDWDVCMNPIKDINNNRYRDWTLWGPYPLDYPDNTRTKDMYVSGAYFCSKKEFMNKNKFDEQYTWGQGEDVEWSLRIRDFWNYKCNYKSMVKLLKPKFADIFCNYYLGE